MPLILLYQIVYFIEWIGLLIEQSLNTQYNIRWCIKKYAGVIKEG